MINRTPEEQRLQDQYTVLVSITGQALSLARAIRDLVLHEKMADLNMAANQAVGVYRSLEFAKSYLAGKMLKLPAEPDKPPPATIGFIENPEKHTTVYHDQDVFLVVAEDTILDPIRKALVCYECHMANLGHSFASLTKSGMRNHLKSHGVGGPMVSIAAMEALNEVPLPD